MPTLFVSPSCPFLADRLLPELAQEASYLAASAEDGELVRDALLALGHHIYGTTRRPPRVAPPPATTMPRSEVAYRSRHRARQHAEAHDADDGQRAEVPRPPADPGRQADPNRGRGGTDRGARRAARRRDVRLRHGVHRGGDVPPGPVPDPGRHGRERLADRPDEGSGRDGGVGPDRGPGGADAGARRGAGIWSRSCGTWARHRRTCSTRRSRRGWRGWRGRRRWRSWSGSWRGCRWARG